MANLTRLVSLAKGGNWQAVSTCPAYIEQTGSAEAIWTVGDVAPANSSFVGHRVGDGGVNVNFTGQTVYMRARAEAAKVIVSGGTPA